jgi:UDP-N-acetyl-D-mannosaminuronate dehydrogenase
VPTLIVAPTIASLNQASATQLAPMVQSQSTSSDDLDAISQDVQQLSEPDVSVDSIPTPLSGDSLNDLNGLVQQEQDMQQVLESLK